MKIVGLKRKISRNLLINRNNKKVLVLDNLKKKE
jgi:hypothetical protein